jgi:hypothetical protein
MPSLGVAPGVQAHQVVELVAARPAGSPGAERRPAVPAGAGSFPRAGRGAGLPRDPEVRPVGQAEETERSDSRLIEALRALLEGVKGGAEARPHGQLADLQLPQAAGGVAEPDGQLADIPAGPGGQPGAGDPDRQGQVAAVAHHLARRLKVPGDAPGAPYRRSIRYL